MRVERKYWETSQAQLMEVLPPCGVVGRLGLVARSSRPCMPWRVPAAAHLRAAVPRLRVAIVGLLLRVGLHTPAQMAPACRRDSGGASLARLFEQPRHPVVMPWPVQMCTLLLDVSLRCLATSCHLQPRAPSQARPFQLGLLLAVGFVSACPMMAPAAHKEAAQMSI